jgi:multicomponent Na+:H+ antiporter subunit B
MELAINAVLLTLLMVITLAIIRQRALFAVVLLSGAYSFLIASVMLTLDAVDVAMTEAAVGAGISTVVLLATLHLTRSREYPRPRPAVMPLVTTLVTGAALIWGTWSLPDFGAAEAPIHAHTSPGYLAAAEQHLVAPNVVTAVLADYRSFDTLGEVIVVFTAGLGVIMLLRGRRRSTVGGKGKENSHEA